MSVFTPNGSSDPKFKALEMSLYDPPKKIKLTAYSVGHPLRAAGLNRGQRRRIKSSPRKK